MTIDMFNPGAVATRLAEATARRQQLQAEADKLAAEVKTLLAAKELHDRLSALVTPSTAPATVSATA